MFFPEYQKTASISTLETVSGKRQWQDTGDAFSLFLQPLSDKDFMQTEGNIADSLKAYTEGEGFKQTDRLIIEGNTYDIRSVTHFNFGTVRHKKLILTKAK